MGGGGGDDVMETSFFHPSCLPVGGRRFQVQGEI